MTSRIDSDVPHASHTHDGAAAARSAALMPYARPELVRMNVANTEAGPFGRGESGTALLDYINGGG